MLKSFFSLAAMSCAEAGSEPKRTKYSDSAVIVRLFSPWLGEETFRNITNWWHPGLLVSPDRCYVLWTLLRQALNLSGRYLGVLASIKVALRQ